MLSTHHLRVWLNMAYSTGVKNLLYLDLVYLHMWGSQRGGWCLDSPCGGSITGSFCSRSSCQYQCAAILPADTCVNAVYRLSVG